MTGRKKRHISVSPSSAGAWAVSSPAGRGVRPISRRIVIASVVALVVGIGLVSVISLVRRPVFGAPMSRTNARSETGVQPEAVTPVQAPEGELEASAAMCGSSAFVDYAPDATGKATPIAAVRSYLPSASNLRVASLDEDRAVVEELRGTVKIASYELFRLGKVGWLVERADTFQPCGSTP